MKIELTKEQIAMLARINAPYDPEVDYDEDADAKIALLDSITNYHRFSC